VAPDGTTSVALACERGARCNGTLELSVTQRGQVISAAAAKQRGGKRRRRAKRRIVIARARFALGPGQRRRVRVRLSKAGRKLLRGHRRRLKATATARTTAGGRSRTARRQIGLRAARHRARRKARRR
jgi:hypothetical protein